jgi:hypothetical protein
MVVALAVVATAVLIYGGLSIVVVIQAASIAIALVTNLQSAATGKLNMKMSKRRILY